MVVKWFGHCSNNPLVTNHRSSLPRKVVELVTHLKTPEHILDHLNLYCIDIMDLLAAIINRAVICEERYAAQEQYIWPCLVIRTLVSCHQIMRRSQRFEWMGIINLKLPGINFATSIHLLNALGTLVFGKISDMTNTGRVQLNTKLQVTATYRSFFRCWGKTTDIDSASLTPMFYFRTKQFLK